MELSKWGYHGSTIFTTGRSPSGAVPWDKRRRCDLPLLQGDYIGEGGGYTSVNFLKITFQYLTLDIMHLGADSRRTVLPGDFPYKLASDSSACRFGDSLRSDRIWLQAGTGQIQTWLQASSTDLLLQKIQYINSNMLY